MYRDRTLLLFGTANCTVMYRTGTVPYLARYGGTVRYGTVPVYCVPTVRYHTVPYGPYSVPVPVPVPYRTLLFGKVRYRYGTANCTVPYRTVPVLYLTVLYLVR